MTEGEPPLDPASETAPSPSPSPSPSPGKTGASTGATVALVAAVVYVAVAFAVHHLFPFFVFDMYTRVPTRASRVLGKEADGTVHEVGHYTRWDCPPLEDIQGGKGPCSEWRVSVARDGEAMEVLRRRAASLPDAPRVELVRRNVRLDVPNPDASASDCVIAVCRASR